MKHLLHEASSSDHLLLSLSIKLLLPLSPLDPTTGPSCVIGFHSEAELVYPPGCKTNGDERRDQHCVGEEQGERRRRKRIRAENAYNEMRRVIQQDEKSDDDEKSDTRRRDEENNNREERRQVEKVIEVEDKNRDKNKSRQSRMK